MAEAQRAYEQRAIQIKLPGEDLFNHSRGQAR